MSDPVIEDAPTTIPAADHEAKVGELTDQITSYKTKVADLEKASGVLGEGMTFKEGWRDQLPEDIREAKFLDRMKDLPSVLKSYDNLERLKGKKWDRPDDTWDDDQVNEWWANNTDWTPMKEDMQVKPPEGVDERLAPIESMVEGFRDVAHANHVSPKAAQAIMDWFYDAQGGLLTQTDEETEAGQIAQTAKLREDIGEKGLFMAKKVASMAATDLGDDILSHPGVSSDPTVIKLLNWMSTHIQESKLPQLDEEITTGDASTEIDDIMNNPNNRYFKGYRGNGTPNQNKLAQDRVSRLFKIKNKGT